MKYRFNICLLIALALITSITIACSSQSNHPELAFPVECKLEKDCLITQYSDDDTSPEWHDYSGGEFTSNGHKGTDIALKNISQMNKGIPVKAAASGIVVSVRNGVSDVNVKEIGISTVNGFECGNRVAINHGNGWITDYCHMKNNSITVKKGDKVVQGQKIGLVGMSGLAELPHLHFSIQKYNDFVDPFTGNGLNSKKIANTSLWKNTVKIPYHPEIIYNIGITREQPDQTKIQSGNFKLISIKPDEKTIFLWVDLLHIKNGDTVKFLISAPDGQKIVDKSFVITRDNVRKFVYLKHTHPTNWKSGIYNVKVVLSENNNVNYTEVLSLKVI